MNTRDDRLAAALDDIKLVLKNSSDVNTQCDHIKDILYDLYYAGYDRGYGEAEYLGNC